MQNTPGSADRCVQYRPRRQRAVNVGRVLEPSATHSISIGAPEQTMIRDLAIAWSNDMQPNGSHLIKFAFDEQLPFVIRGEGIFVFDTQDRRWVDGCSGAVTVNLGHSDPKILSTIAEQAGRITFAHRGTFNNEPAEQLADRLSELTGYPYVLLCNSGSEAIEAALKMVLQMWRERGEPERAWFTSHAIGYHGSTLGGLSLSGHPLRRLASEPLLHRFNTLTPPYSYRYAEGQDDASFTTRLLADADTELERHARTQAGVVLEPVGGAAGGAIVPPPGYLEGMSAICRRRGIPLIADEVMTGLGRTGRMLAVDHFGVKPDVVVLGKGLGAGYTPIAAVLFSTAIIDAIADGTGAVTTGHTYSGNPLSCAVALAVLNEVVSRDLVAAAQHRGEELRTGLDALAGRHPLIGEVRGVGLLQGLELVRDRDTRSPGLPVGSLTRTLVNEARNQGLLIYPATGGVNDAVLVAPPLTITPTEIDLLLHLLDLALANVENGLLS